MRRLRNFWRLITGQAVLEAIDELKAERDSLAETVSELNQEINSLKTGIENQEFVRRSLVKRIDKYREAMQSIERTSKESHLN